MQKAYDFIFGLLLLVTNKFTLILCACLVSLFLTLLSPSASPCQSACTLYEVSSTRGVLIDLDNLPIKNANLVVREAGLKAHGPVAFCNTRFGHVVLKTKTNRKGYFDLQGLEVGQYWVTYMDPKDGESFLVRITSLEGGKRFELGVNHWIGSLCGVPDVERNESKPPGAFKPVDKDL